MIIEMDNKAMSPVSFVTLCVVLIVGLSSILWFSLNSDSVEEIELPSSPSFQIINKYDKGRNLNLEIEIFDNDTKHDDYHIVAIYFHTEEIPTVDHFGITYNLEQEGWDYWTDLKPGMIHHLEMDYEVIPRYEGGSKNYTVKVFLIPGREDKRPLTVWYNDTPLYVGIGMSGSSVKENSIYSEEFNVYWF